MNRPLVLTLLLTTVSTAGAAATGGVDISISRSDASGLTLEVTLPDSPLDNPDASGFSIIPGGGEEGEGIPALTRWVAVPEGSKPVVRVRDAQRTTYSNYEAAFAGGGGVEGGGLRRDESTPAQSGTNALEPAQPVMVGRTLVFRGVPIAPVTLFPVQVAGAGGVAIRNKRLSFDIDFIPDPEAPRGLRRVSEAGGREPARLMDELLLNPPLRDDHQYPYLAHILILHDQRIPQQALPWIDSLATWKRMQGYRVSIEAVDQNQESALRIRQMIREDYFFNRNDPISHLIIIGADSTGASVYFKSSQQGDHYFSLMDDNDAWSSDITVGRFYVHSISELQGAVKRSIYYERSPYTDEGTDWFTHALLTAENIAAPGGQFVPSMVQLVRWMNYRLEHYGYTDTDTLFAASENERGRVNEQVRDILEDEGVGLAISRGWLEGCFIDRDPAETGRRNPFIVAITCLSSALSQDYFRAVTPNNLRGPVASLSMTGLTHTKGNNNILGWAVRRIVYDNVLQPGVIQLLTKYSVFSDLQYDDAALENDILPTIYAYRLLGDPTTNVFTRVPGELDVLAPESITPATTGLEVRVTNGGDPVADAVVALYQPGGIQLVAIPDADGWARFTLDPGELGDEDIILTVTRPNSIPHIGAIGVIAGDVVLGLGDVTFNDDDGLFGNGDTVGVTLELTNESQEDATGVTVYLATDDPRLTIEPDTLQMGDMEAGGSAAVEFDLELNRSSKPYREVRVGVAAADEGGHRWEHAFTFVTSGPWLALQRFDDEDPEFDRGVAGVMTPYLFNIGDLQSPAVDAELVCLEPEKVEVVVGEVSYPAVNTGQAAQPSGNAAFRVAVSDYAIPGDLVEFELRLAAQDEEDAYRDTVRFQRPVGESVPTDPSPPDEYGYVCFDSHDEGWDKRPDYDWIEINPHKRDRDFDGERLDIRDITEDHDSSLVVELPFTFQYYGRGFDTLVVCSNGWVAFGAEQSQFVHFRNWRIPGIQGPDAQLAVFWDDLIVPDPTFRGIFYYYDEDRSIFVVEWSEMEVYYPREPGAPPRDRLEFQLILYDPEFYPTSTGDGEIKMQYKHPVIHQGNLTDTHYFTLGVRNLDNTGGIEYAYWNHYPSWARPLEDEMALLYTVDVEPLFGDVTGRVVLARDTTESLSGAEVRSLRDPENRVAITNERGEFRLDDLLVGRHLLEVAKPGYNTAHVTADIAVDQVLVLEPVLMTSPSISVDTEPVQRDAQPGHSADDTLFIHNSGDGELEFRLSQVYADGAPLEIVPLQATGVAAEIGVDRLYGCQLVGDEVFISGDPDRNQSGDNRIYVLNRGGELVRNFLQPSLGFRGFQDLAYDGRRLYGGEDTLVFKFSTDGDPVDTFNIRSAGVDLADAKALAWNSESRTLFIGQDYYDIYEVRLGDQVEVVRRFRPFLPGEFVQVQGLAWNPADADGMYLYIMDWVSGDDARRMRLVKMDPVSGETAVVGDISQHPNDKGRSLSVGFDWDEGYSSLVSLAEDFSRDTLRVYRLGPDSRFLRYVPSQSMVAAGEVGAVQLQFFARDLPERTFSAGVRIDHNAAGDYFVVPVYFTVDRNSDVDSAGELPLEFALEEAYPNPFNGVTRIRFSLDRAGAARLAVYDLSGRQVRELLVGELPAGQHQVVFDADNLASGIYFYRLQARGRSVVKRMVLLK